MYGKTCVPPFALCSPETELVSHTACIQQEKRALTRGQHLSPFLIPSMPSTSQVSGTGSRGGRVAAVGGGGGGGPGKSGKGEGGHVIERLFPGGGGGAA